MTDELSYREETVDETLDDHESRITRNERFRERAKGAIAVISMMLGGGFALTIALALV